MFLGEVAVDPVKDVQRSVRSANQKQKNINDSN